MIDRHLFKAKRIDTGEWVEGSLVPLGKYSFSDPDRYGIVKKAIPVGFQRVYYNLAIEEVDPTTVSQCTGMTDKKETLIWESDRCRVTRPGTLAYGTIKYIQACFCFVEDSSGTILRLFDLKTNGYEIEVLEVKE